MSSQNNEDAILKDLLDRIGEGNRIFWEIGTGPDARECNTAALLDQGWHGFWIDKDGTGGGMRNQSGAPDVWQIRVTADNVNELLPQGNDFADVFSLDVDGNDYWIWKAMWNRPRIVVIEYNEYFGLNRRVQDYDPTYTWDGRSKTFGASLLSLVDLGWEKGYRLVDCNGVNAFFIRDDVRY